MASLAERSIFFLKRLKVRHAERQAEQPALSDFSVALANPGLHVQADTIDYCSYHAVLEIASRYRIENQLNNFKVEPPECFETCALVGFNYARFLNRTARMELRYHPPASDEEAGRLLKLAEDLKRGPESEDSLPEPDPVTAQAFQDSLACVSLDDARQLISARLCDVALSAVNANPDFEATPNQQDWVTDCIAEGIRLAIAEHLVVSKTCPGWNHDVLLYWLGKLRDHLGALSVQDFTSLTEGPRDPASDRALDFGAKMAVITTARRHAESCQWFLQDSIDGEIDIHAFSENYIANMAEGHRRGRQCLSTLGAFRSKVAEPDLETPPDHTTMLNLLAFVSAEAGLDKTGGAFAEWASGIAEDQALSLALESENVQHAVQWVSYESINDGLRLALAQALMFNVRRDAEAAGAAH